MPAILLSATVTCVASLFLGQAVLRLSGAGEWNWLAPAVGISVVMVIASPAPSVPGRCATLAVLVALLTIAAIVWCMRSPQHRPPLSGVLAAAPVLVLVLVPFLAAWRQGILGTTVDNDMAAHLLFTESIISQKVANLTAVPPEYPLGPHSMVARVAKGFGMRTDHAFTGWTMALPILNAWTALALLRRASWLKQAIVAIVVGMPFLVAAYYGEGSFKELVQASLVLAAALFLCGCGPKLGRGRWVPFGLIAAGMVSVYSITGLPWPAAFFVLWLLGLLAQRIYRHGTDGLFAAIREAVRSELPALGIGLAAGLVVLLPQAGRIHDFITVNLGGNGIVVPKGVLGNLVAPLPAWEAFGVWNNLDFRLPSSGLAGTVLTAFVVALVLYGVYCCLRRGRWMLPLAAAASMLIWADSIHSQSPYTVAKALVIVSPLLLALAVVPLLEQLPDRLPRSFSSLFRTHSGGALPWALGGLLVVGLVLGVGISDVRALRAAPIGPPDHADQLRSLKPVLGDQPTLFLGNDDFVRWELAGVNLGTPIFGVPTGSPPIRPEARWEAGMALDFDLMTAKALNSYHWFITTRDAAASKPPPQIHLVESTADYQLWRRTGEVRERSILPEGGMPGAVLKCGTLTGRKVLRAGGVAAVQAPPVVAEAPLLTAGASSSVSLPLGPGRWQLESTYTSRLAVEVTAPGLSTTLPANLDRPGPRWPIGGIVVVGNAPTEVSFRVEDPLFAPTVPVAVLGTVVATRDRPERIVPIARACGRYVDWYGSAGSRGAGRSQ